MNARAHAHVRMSFEDYLVWEETQEEKHELVDGRPVLRRILRGMAGGRRSHSQIAGFLITAINARLPEDGPCVALTSDFKVKSPTGNSRYPDVTVDCSPGDGKDLFTTEPTLVAEVLSPSNDDKDLKQRLADYKATPSLRHIVLLAQDRPSAELWTRRGAAWRSATIGGRDAVLELPALALSIPFKEIYRKTGGA